MFWLCMGILISAFPITEFGQGFIPAINKVSISTCGWYSMLAVVYIFFFLLVVDFIRLLDRYFGFVPGIVKHDKKTPVIIGCLIVLLVVVFLIVLSRFSEALRIDLSKANEKSLDLCLRKD